MRTDFLTLSNNFTLKVRLKLLKHWSMPEQMQILPITRNDYHCIGLVQMDSLKLPGTKHLFLDMSDMTKLEITKIRHLKFIFVSNSKNRWTNILDVIHPLYKGSNPGVQSTIIKIMKCQTFNIQWVGWGIRSSEIWNLLIWKIPEGQMPLASRLSHKWNIQS